MKIQKNHSLKKQNTFGVDVNAKYFCEVSDFAEIKKAVEYSRSKNLPILIMGDGANILFTKDFEGIVIKVNIRGINIADETPSHVFVRAGAGVEWDDLVKFAVEKNWGGIENMAFIPGKVGAAAVQNIAAYGQNLVDVFVSLTAVDLKSLEVKQFSKSECKFKYRESIFKNKYRNKFLVLDVTVKLQKNPKVDISYFETGKTYTTKGSLEMELEKIATPPFTVKDIYKAITNIRKRKLPNPKEIGTAGSFFKNPIVTTEKFLELRKIDPDLQYYPVGKLVYKKLDDKFLSKVKHVKVPAGRLLDNLGWKGKRIGEIGTFPTQALAVVNYGASGSKILEFTKKMQKAVYDNYGIKLEPEVVIL